MRLEFVLLALLLAAQEPPIIVTGERPNAEQIHREAHDFVESHAVRTRIGQYARWHVPICVRTWGLPLELNARISNRVMDIADSIGIRTNRADPCRPNVRIGFTTEPQRMIRAAARRNSLIVGFHYASEGARLMRVRQPVQAWYVTTTSGDGSRNQGGVIGTETIDVAGQPVPGGRSDSRLTAGLSSGLAHVLIFADVRVAEGQDTDAIAELLAFLALAQTPVAEACNDSDTIVNLMNPACPPERRPVALTRADTAYLRALYEMNATIIAQHQRGDLVTHMVREMESPPPAHPE
ncbi:MAG: hypothetical protein E6G92_07050 [Alphaproteobacteria bacterium]|nr:MAG: hypothetical protein E6G92_07050 [Alphaproteobacteria bacterium]